MNRRKRHLWPALLVAVGSFVLFGALILLYLDRAQEIWEKDERTRIFRILNNKRSSLESELFARIYYTKSVAAYVSLHPTASDTEFYNLADELIQEDSIIKTMSLAKDGVIGSIYPPEGNDAVIGLNLMEHRERAEIVRQTLESGKTFVAGPVDLVEGGVAFISYTPIFDKTEPGETRYWGITDIVIQKDALIRSAGITEQENGVRFAIRGYDGKGADGAIFFGDPEVFASSPVSVEAKLPDGEWILAAIPEGGWSGYLDQDRIFFLVLVVSGLVISILLGLFASAVYRIRNDALQMGSIFNGMTGWVLELDRDFQIVWRASTRARDRSIWSRLQIGENLPSALPELAEVGLETLNRCLDSKAIESFEMAVEDAGEMRWKQVTVSPKGENLILVVQEITLQKEQQAQLRKSEEALRKLNANKDRLFSIIAHDLRTPFSAITGLSDQLLQTQAKLSPEEQRYIIELIFQSGKENLHLLDNLLNWARSQQDGLVAKKEAIELAQLVAASITVMREVSAHKKVKLVNEVSPDLSVSFDKPMLEAIFRNLISNAIKFSRAGGMVEVGVRPCEDAAEVEIFVRDSGVGMDLQTLALISGEAESSYSSVGTNNERGVGLGLSLCRDFLAQHGQFLRIESEPEVGTTVSFRLERVVVSE